MLPFISRDLALMDEISAMAREDHKSMTNVQHQIQADRSGKIWINVSNNDPRLNINGIVARIRPVYNHTVKASQHQTMLKIDGVWTEASMFTHCRMKGSI